VVGAGAILIGLAAFLAIGRFLRILDDGADEPASVSASAPSDKGSSESAGQPAPSPTPPEVDSVLLAWKFAEPFRYRLSWETRQHLKYPNREADVVHNYGFSSRWTPRPAPQGGWNFTQKLEDVQFQVRSGFRTLQFDSRDKDGAVAQLLRGAEILLDLETDGRVRNVHGTKALLQTAQELAPELKAILPLLLQADVQKHLAEGIFNVLPGREVKKGEGWSQEKQLPAPLGGRFSATYQYTYAGMEGNLHRILLKAPLRFQAPTQAHGGPLAEGTELAGDLTGTLWFDADKGRLARTEIQRRIEGRLAIAQLGESETMLVEILNVQNARAEFSDAP
jgi:hypothetical protein